MVYLRARWYDAGSGRFGVRDPFAGFPEVPYSLNPYQYAYAAPTVYTDPSGQVIPFCPIGYLPIYEDGEFRGCEEDPDFPAWLGFLKETVILPGPVGATGTLGGRLLPMPPLPPLGKPVLQGCTALIAGALALTGSQADTDALPRARQRRDDENLVYRVMRPGEHPVAMTQGIWARDPSRRVHPQRHVTHGNREADNWISTTRNLMWALTWQTNDKQPIYAIDLKKVPSPIIDLTVPANTAGWTPRAKQLAVRASEVLVDTHIPATAIVDILPWIEFGSP
jgi:hypothetical protein